VSSSPWVTVDERLPLRDATAEWDSSILARRVVITRHLHAGGGRYDARRMRSPLGGPRRSLSGVRQAMGLTARLQLEGISYERIPSFCTRPCPLPKK
jgi:hypothetical protein